MQTRVQAAPGQCGLRFQVSLVAGEDAVERIEGWLADGFDIPDSSLLVGKAHLYTGYSYLLLSEAFCQVAFKRESSSDARGRIRARGAALHVRD